MIDKDMLPKNPVTRFAPSPTGCLHLGHVASAIFVWGVAKVLGAKVILRFEDHDRQRSKKHFISNILHELEYLGFICKGDFGWDCLVYNQSENEGRYEKALDWLRSKGLTYACSCSRKDINNQNPSNDSVELLYLGTCRNKHLAESDNLGLRVLFDGNDEQFIDLIKGVEVQNPGRQCGDLLIKDRRGNWTYHFSNVVDDLYDLVNIVVRGEDLFDSCGRQIKLMKLLSANKLPVYLHHPLILDNSQKEKLSKKRRSLSISQLIDQKVPPQAILAEAAFQIGLCEKIERLSIEEVERFFVVKE
ncbi:MAG: glutamate--tRNA ligase family protein [Bdellovibrionota bacterium]